MRAAPGRVCRGFFSTGPVRPTGTTLREKIYNLCKNRGFIYPGSEIYGGFQGTHDYGPLGAQLKRNVANLWWRDFVTGRKDCVGLDSSIITHPQVWETAGHVQHFTDPLVICQSCQARHRADHLVEGAEVPFSQPKEPIDAWLAALKEAIQKHNIACPGCGKATLGEPRLVNLLCSTAYGSTHRAYLRPETAQGIFLNFAHVVRTMRRRPPFGIGQIGKSFRNEIATGHFLFRAREFEQMELEYFCEPADSMKTYEEWVSFCKQWLQRYGLKDESIRLKEYGKEDLAHYARATTDIEFRFAHGWGELWGIAHRGDFDLKQHQEATGQNLQYKPEPEQGAPPEKLAPYWPHVIEPAVGLDRLVLAFLTDAYSEEVVRNETRIVLRLHPQIAPFKFAVLPLQRKQPFIDVASSLFDKLIARCSTDWDLTGSIGKRYRRHDEIGTPYCVTVDTETPKDGAVTVRDRDTMRQERVPLERLAEVADSYVFGTGHGVPVNTSKASV